MVNEELKLILQKQDILLIGFMGSGKSYLGNILATELNSECLDTDEYIAQKQGMSIFTIFQSKGEKYFRQLEKNLLQDLTFINSPQKRIIASGGGFPIPKGNQKLIKIWNPLVIYLAPSFETIYSRLQRSQRPLIYRRSKKTIFQLWGKRYSIYQSIAHIAVVEEKMEKIFDTLQERIKLLLHSKLYSSVIISNKDS